MSTLKYAALGALALAALAVAPDPAEAGTTNNTATWCKTKGPKDAHILSDSSSTLVWKTTGELVLEATNHLAARIWSSGTANQGSKLCFESDGDLSIYNSSNTKLWSQSGGSVPTYSGLYNVKYEIEPSMSDCDLSAKYTATYSYLGISATQTGTLWTKAGDCPVAGKTAIANNWCADNTEEAILLQDDWSQLVWKPAGFLALIGTGTAAGTQIWQTPTSGAGKKLCFETDGELVVYDAANQPIWRTDADTITSGYMLDLDACTLEIKRLDGDASPWTSSHRCPQSQMLDNKTVYAGASDVVLVKNDDAELVFDAGGNVVLRSASGDVYWTSALTAGVGKKLVFQTDGNLVIYNSSNVAKWTSGTAGQSVDELLLDGCAFSLTTGSSTKFSRGSSSCSQTSLGNSWSLSASGNATLLRSDEATVVWQADGNLVLYSLGGSALWSSGTSGSGKTLSFQSDGNLVIYNSSSAAVWDSNTNVSGSPSYSLELGDSCTLTIASGSTVKWTGNSSCAVVNYSLEQSEGNSVFGATLRTELTAEDTGTARVDTTTSIDLTILGVDIELFSATTYQTETDNGSDLGNVALTIFGESAVSVNATYEQTFFEKSQTFTVGFVPVTVTAGATGELKLGLSYAGGALTITPSAGIYATLSAGVGADSDVAGASAGIRGTLTLIEVSLPIEVKVYVESGKAKYSVSGTLELDTLSGSLELYAEAYVKVLGVKIGVDWSKTLFSWDGFSWSKSLFDKEGSF